MPGIQGINELGLCGVSAPAMQWRGDLERWPEACLATGGRVMTGIVDFILAAMGSHLVLTSEKHHTVQSLEGDSWQGRTDSHRGPCLEAMRRLGGRAGPCAEKPWWLSQRCWGRRRMSGLGARSEVRP